VPGDYVLGFFKKMIQSHLHVITTCDEQGAGFVADAYARMNGFGIVCVTYGGGAASRSPMPLARPTPRSRRSWSSAGSPGSGECLMGPLLPTRYTSSTTR